MLTVKTQKSIEELIKESVKIAVDEAVKVATKVAYEEGFHAGLISNKEGIYLGNTGMYVFKDGHASDVKII